MSESKCVDCGEPTDNVHYRGWSSYRGAFVVYRCMTCLGKGISEALQAAGPGDRRLSQGHGQ
jgi:hypothetical protein